METREAEFRLRTKLNDAVSPRTIWCGESCPKAEGVWVRVDVLDGVPVGDTETVVVAVGDAVGVRVPVPVGLAEFVTLGVDVGVTVEVLV